MVYLKIGTGIIPTFVKDGPPSSLTVRRAAYGDGNSALHLPNKAGEQILSYVEAVNYLLKSYVTDVKIAEATSEVADLWKVPVETSLQFADVLWVKNVRCENAYSAEWTKGIFIGRPSSIYKAWYECYGAANRKLTCRGWLTTPIRYWRNFDKP